MSRKKKKIIVIGIDGLDYHLVNQYFKKNLLPNLAGLKKNGYYYKLKTTTPPQSPVAWASFITGTRPAEHQVFDFIVRNPNNYLLTPVFSPAANQSPLKAEPFWEKTLKQQIPTQVFFLPDNYPPGKTYGQAISGMGTPDVLGTEGTSYLFTTDKKFLKDCRGIKTLLPKNKKKLKTFIKGPRFQTLKGIKHKTIPLYLELKQNSIIIKTAGQKIELKKEQFSQWLTFNFKIGPLKNIQAIGRFFLKSIKPQLILHLSPLNIDPRKPVFPVSYPKKFAKQLVEKYGLFSTLGLPHDNWALNGGIFSEKDFLKEAEIIFQKRKKIILDHLENFKKGLFVGYIGTSDSIQHMFFRHLNKNNQFQKIIPELYQKMDSFAGEVIKRIDKNTLLIFLSDHGFARFDWEINLNSWLRNKNFLQLNSGTTSKELYNNVDWNKTKAYAAGFNSIYLNKKGREQKGIVKEKTNLIKKIKKQLKKFTYKNKPVVKNVYSKKDLKIKPAVDSPDLIVGYYKGFRASWETAVGAVPEKTIKKRQQKWSGDHLFDADEVPGVLFSNHNLSLKNPFIGDIIWKIIERFQ